MTQCYCKLLLLLTKGVGGDSWCSGGVDGLAWQTARYYRGSLLRTLLITSK